MENAVFIDTSEKENKALDFKFLKSEAIRFIQELTGAFWTDYNEHDPGVTILEQLVYALTDLAYRTEFDIQDHLFGKHADDKTFYFADEILPCSPLTINDYRKILFDSIQEIKNVWFFPTTNEENSLLGLYKIYVDFGEENKQIVPELKRKLRQIYAANRNLCEDIEDIVVLEQMPISIFADIEVEKMNDIEQILADIYFQVNEFLNPEVHFYSLPEMLHQGFEVNRIFEGPLLEHGFIKNQDLHPKIDKIAISEIIKILMQVKGVASVKNLYLKSGTQVFDNQMIIPKNQVPKLIFGSAEGREDFTINFFKGSISNQAIDMILFKRKLNELQSANKRVYRNNDVALEYPKGRKINIEEYYSIQHQFPEIYGIGPAGIPNKPDEKRKAQAKQLKGFLLLFEQIMANYLAQLAHIKDLFSSKNEVHQTYFYQSLESIPQLAELVKNHPNLTIDAPLLKGYDIPLSYQEGLKKLIAIRDNFIDRRNRFLDFMLASNGDSYLEYSASQKNFYFTDEEYAIELLKNKSRLLQYLPKINKHRSKAYNYFEDTFAEENLSGLEMRLSILLGMGFGNHGVEHSTFQKKALFDVYESRKLKIVLEDVNGEWKNWQDASNIQAVGLSPEILASNFDYIDDEDFKSLEFDKEYTQNLLEKTLPFQTHIVTNMFLRYGLSLHNYRIGKVNEEADTFSIIFQNPEKETWHFIANCDTYEDALATAQILTKTIRDLNVESEGFHLIEHILFRPDVKDKKFGVYLLDEEGKNFLRTVHRFTFEDRLKMIEQIKKHLFIYENYSVEHRPDGDFEISFQSTDKSISFVSLQAFESVQDIHDKLEKVFAFLSDKEYVTPYQDKIGLYIQNLDEEETIPEDFFSYRCSVVLPDWTTRFSNAEFRLVAEDILRENKPANVSIEILWLNIQDMKDFEKNYYDWLEKKQKNGLIEKEKLDKQTNHFLELLRRLYVERKLSPFVV